MAMHDDCLEDAEMLRTLMIASSPNAPYIGESLLRRPSTASSSSEGSATGSHTPASSVYSEDFKQQLDVAASGKPWQKSTVIHEEEAGPSRPSSPSSEAASPPRLSTGERMATATMTQEAPTTPPDSPAAQPRRALQPVEYELPYSHETMPWDRFYSARPEYPPSLFELFLDYHRGPLDTLHDLAAGSGLAADGLLTALSHRSGHPHGGGGEGRILPRTILSDPGGENVGIATRFMGARHPSAALECWEARGEDQDMFLVPNSVDMTICAEALHWMDMPSVISQVGRSLRPGGTFAVVLYSCFPRILNNVRVKKALRALVEDHLNSRVLKDTHAPRTTSSSSPSAEADNDSTSTSSTTSPLDSPTTAAQLHPNWARGMRALAYGLDAVELPADEWECIQRHEVNCGTTGWWWPSASKEALGCAPPRADASPHERLVYESYEDWGRRCSGEGVRELRELLESTQVGFGEKTWEGPAWKELEAAVKGPLHFVWQVHMILAKKKGPGLEAVAEEA